MNLRLAHFSDLHFGVVTLDPRQFLSKRWLGNTNLLFFRQNLYSKEHLTLLPSLLKKLNVQALSITGDFSSTSLDEEFEQAARFLSQFAIPTLLIPGNHDCYTKESQKESCFYRHFPNPELKNHRIVVKRLNERWSWIGLDCTLATPLFHSYGLFSSEMEILLEKTLSELPRDEKVIVACHWPLENFRGHRHDLKRKEALKEILLSYPQVKLYLHGHDHRANLRQNNTLVMVGGGSLANKKRAPFFLFDLREEAVIIERYHLKNQKSWIPIEKKEIRIID